MNDLIAPIPILRSFNETEAKTFYLDYLGFQLDWEHRFDQNMPLYMQISLGNCKLHLSEHHADCTPGSALRIGVKDLTQFKQTLEAKNHPRIRPAIQAMPWGTRDMSITDPFGNRLCFTDQLNA